MTSVAEDIVNSDELATLQSMGGQYGQAHLLANLPPADQVLVAMDRVHALH